MDKPKGGHHEFIDSELVTYHTYVVHVSKREANKSWNHILCFVWVKSKHKEKYQSSKEEFN
jgi:hypothetical protein